MTQETPRPALGALHVRRVRTHHLREAKRRSEKFTMLTCYDSLTAAIFDVITSRCAPDRPAAFAVSARTKSSP